MSNIGKYESANPLKRALLKRFLNKARAAVPKTEELSILDIGTGEGLFWNGMAHTGVIGIDLRQDALAVASEHGIVTPVMASAEDLPFRSQSFDYALAIEILEHLPQPGLAVSEMARVARIGGLITVPWEPWFSLMVLFGTGQHWRRMGREPEHIQAFGPNDLETLLVGHFSGVEVSTCLPWLIARVSR